MAAAALVLSGGCARNTGSHSQYLLFFNVACMCLFDSNGQGWSTGGFSATNVEFVWCFYPRYSRG